MLRQFTDTETLYFRSMGKALRVTAIATSDTEANDHMARHSEATVIGVCGPFVLMADRFDKGIPI